MALQRYRLRIYDGAYEVLHQRLFTIDIDLDSPARDSLLAHKLAALSSLAEAVGESMNAPVLTVHDIRTDTKILDWV
jgi:hypothetical protein